MNLDQYRAEVRTVACPMDRCGVGAGCLCVRVVTCLSSHHGQPAPHEHREPVQYVHDDRSLAHLLHSSRVAS